MSTQAQKAANRANSKRSTGPVTPAGKARSAANSRKHDLCSQVVLPGLEDAAEFNRMFKDFIWDTTPDGEVEVALHLEMVTAAWQLRRIRCMESEACEGAASYSALLDDEALQKKLDRLARHHTRFERTFHRCFKQLKALRDARRATKLISKRSQFSHPLLQIDEPTPATPPEANVAPAPTPTPAAAPTAAPLAQCPPPSPHPSPTITPAPQLTPAPTAVSPPLP